MAFFSLASQKMAWLSARQTVIAENVANADTPGFKAREVSSFRDMLSGAHRPSEIAVTDPRHLGGAGPTRGVRTVDDPQAWANSINGNSVVLEQQSIKATEVAESYRLASTLYRKGYELLTLSVTGGK